MVTWHNNAICDQENVPKTAFAEIVAARVLRSVELGNVRRSSDLKPTFRQVPKISRPVLCQIRPKPGRRSELFLI